MTFYAKVYGEEMKICTSNTRFYKHALIRIERGHFKCLMRTLKDTSGLLSRYEQILASTRQCMDDLQKAVIEKNEYYHNVNELYGDGYCEKLYETYFNRFWHFQERYMIVDLYTKEAKK